MAVQVGGRALVGRDFEVGVLEDQLVGVKEHGSAMVIRGDAGIGKSALLDAARRLASDRGMASLTTAGVQSEAPLAFAGLHQLLRPALPDALDRLRGPQRRALAGAFGLSDGPSPDFFLIALATVELLSDLAASSPLLLVVEDAHWLDPATSDVLAFAARRLEAEPIVALLEVREGLRARIDHAGLREIRLAPLGSSASAALVDATAPNLAPEIRSRVLAEALGNPLALIELPRALAAGFDPSPDLPLPLTERLERTFAASVSGFPRAIRTMLLLAALDDNGYLGPICAASSALEGRSLEPSDLSTAIDGHVITIADNRIRFAHPLVRSAIYAAADGGERRAGHAALAHAYRDDPDRSVWHRAASIDVPDDRVAAELENAARRAERRGASAMAAAALERSAELTTGDERRGRLLLRAASIEAELGRRDVSARLVKRASERSLVPDDQTMLPILLELFEEGTWTGVERIGPLVELADRQATEGEIDRALDTLQIVSSRCWWGNPPQEMRGDVVAVAERIPIASDDPRLVSVLAQADPVRCGSTVIDWLSRASVSYADPEGSYLFGIAANAVWSCDLALVFLDTAIGGLRAQGRLGLLAEALVAQAWAAVHAAREPLAVSAAEEAIDLSREAGHRRSAASAQLAKAAIAAERGDLELMESLTREAEHVILGTGATPMLALAHFVRGRAAVAHQQYADGLEHLRRVQDPGDAAYHPFIGAWSLSDLVEAAAHTGQDAAAREYLERLESLAGTTGGSLLLAEAGYARPMVADDERAEDLYRSAIERDLANWPCYRGRILLWYGRWLRRQRRAIDSRSPLRRSREVFDALAFPKLTETAYQELRAAGESSRPPAGSRAWDQLTPQELQIARLAADGLTNREIGQRLYLSHRTVESHLYRIFPKLGVTTRGRLREAIPETVPV
jgi:DNA-binding CsgD family transcriptional regulator